MAEVYNIHMVGVIDEDCICKVCNKQVSGVVFTRVYSHKNDFPVCVPCYNAIQFSKGKHYSALMDKVAMLEMGYRINRKIGDAASLRSRRMVMY
jgi:hypothetical protein